MAKIPTYATKARADSIASNRRKFRKNVKVKKIIKYMVTKGTKKATKRKTRRTKKVAAVV